MALNKNVGELTALLNTSLASGQSSTRIEFGAKDRAFSYLPPTVNALASVISTGVAANRSVTAMTVEHVADVVAWTAGDKPKTAQVTSAPIALKTYPGYCTITTHDLMDSTGLGAAVTSTLYNQAVLGLDKDLIAMLKGATPTIDKAATLATIAEAQAELMGNGFSPDVVAVSPALYGTLASTNLITGGANPQEAVQYALGARLVVSPSLGAAEAVVLDSMAVVAVEHDRSPVLLASVNAVKNSIDLVVELVAVGYIAQQAGVASIWDKP